MPTVCSNAVFIMITAPEGDVKVDGNDREFLDLIHGALMQRRFRAGIGYHEGLLSILVRE